MAENQPNLYKPTNEYNALIAKIQKKKKIVLVIAIIAAAVTILLGSEYYSPKSGSYVSILGPVPCGLILLGILIVSFVSYAFVIAPLTNSLYNECDPRKHLVLNSVLNKHPLANPDMAASFLLLGDFERAEYHYDQFSKHKNPHYRFTAMFGKARCEFFLGKNENLNTYFEQLKLLLNTEKFSKRRKMGLGRCLDSLENMCSLALGDTEKIAATSEKLQPWDTLKASESYFHYFKGLSALALGDRENAVYHLVWLKENAPKTVLAVFAEKSLAELKAK